MTGSYGSERHDGWVWRLDPESGAALRWANLGVPLTAPVAALPGGDLLAAGSDGSLRRLGTEPPTV